MTYYLQQDGVWVAYDDENRTQSIVVYGVFPDELTARRFAMGIGATKVKLVFWGDDEIGWYDAPKEIS
jgi:hypothetical protein